MACPYPVDLASAIGTITLDDDWDAYGFWTWSELKGWFETSVRQTLLDPAGAEGQILAESVRSSRPLVLVGFAGAVDGDGWWRAANRLEAVTASLVSTPGTLTVHEPGGDKSVAVSMSPGGLGVARRGVLPASGVPGEVATGFEFQVPLIAPNPDKT